MRNKFMRKYQGVPIYWSFIALALVTIYASWAETLTSANTVILIGIFFLNLYLLLRKDDEEGEK